MGQDNATVHLSLNGQHQRVNAALAVELAIAFDLHIMRTQHGDRIASSQAGGTSDRTPERMNMLGSRILPAPYLYGLSHTNWPGRCQVFAILCTLEKVVVFLCGLDPGECLREFYRRHINVPHKRSIART